jgi:hypothetical protein
MIKKISILIISIFVIVIVFLCLRFLYIVTTLDTVEREGIKNHIFYYTNPKYNDKKYILSSIQNKLKPKNYIKIFESKNNFLLDTEGLLFCSQNLKQDIKKHESKLFWHTLFTNYNIEQPTLVTFKQNGLIKRCKNYYNDLNNEYIFKPNIGQFGLDIRKIKGSEIDSILQKEDDFIVQKIVKDCFYKNGIRHFRFISLYNGSNYLIWQLSTNTHIISNHAQGSIVNLVYYKNKYFYNLSTIEKNLLNDMMKNLSNLHKTEFADFFSIGWDIMFSCDNGDIKAVCLEGNLVASIYFPFENENNIININQIMNNVKKEYNNYIK